MINISNELKQIYNNDILPLVAQSAEKDLILYFPSLDLTIETDQIVDDSFSLDESLFSDSDITFGTCEATQVKFKVADVEQDLKGQIFTLTQTVNGTYTMALGTYIVASCIKQDDLRYKEIIAYDKMKNSDIDVSAWYNGLTFPLTLANFRASLLSHLDIDEEVKTLPNDAMLVYKTIQPTKLKGRDVLQACEEINGCFGHMNRYGKFAHIVLEPSYGLYPTVTLLPADDLYPVSASDKDFYQVGSESAQLSVAMCQSVRFEEYTVKELDKLQIRQEEGDIGAIVGTGSNTYVIEGNFLVYGKTASELETIAINAFGNMQKRPYRPFESENIGLPYIELGDTIAFATDDVVAGYVFKRTLTGIQALRDSFSASGNEEREQNFSFNIEIEQLKGKANVLRRTVEELSNTITDVEEGLESKITQTASSLETQITDTKSGLESQITQTAGQIRQEVSSLEDDLYAELNVMAGQIDLKVDANGVIAAINLSPGTAKIQASKIVLEGLVTANNYFKIRTDGSMEAVNGTFSGTITGGSININSKFTVDSSGNLVANGANIVNGTFSGILTSPTINGGKVNSAQIISESGSSKLTINGGYLDIQQSSYYTSLYGGSVVIGDGSNTMSISPTNINCKQFTGWATSAYKLANTSSSNYNAYVSANDNLISTSSTMYLGSSGSLWAGVYALNGTINTSDERRKDNIMDLDIRFRDFAKLIMPYTYQMIEGSSGRFHVGFLAQRIEEDMQKCGISSDEFAGFIKSPVYSKRFEDGEYDTTSEIIDYQYALRYSEFIPLAFLWLKDIEEKVNRLL